MNDSKGTLQPDILRVLVQDGFTAETVSDFSQRNLEHIEHHLATGNYILALYQTEAGGMHWVVFTESDGTHVTVADSLRKQPYQVALKQFSEEKLLNTILLSPGIPNPGSPYFNAHLKGTLAMLRSSKIDILWIVITGAIIAILLTKYLRFSLRKGKAQ